MMPVILEIKCYTQEHVNQINVILRKQMNYTLFENMPLQPPLPDRPTYIQVWEDLDLTSADTQHCSSILLLDMKEELE